MFALHHDLHVGQALVTLPNTYFHPCNWIAQVIFKVIVSMNEIVAPILVDV
jgi:hypothetical protein